LRSRTVAFDRRAFPDEQRQDPRLAPRALRLDLFDDVSHTADLERIDRTHGGFAWIGRVRGSPLSTVTLASAGGVLAGSVIMPGAAYAIRSAAGGLYEILEIDESKLPPEGEPLVPGRAARPPAGNTSALPLAGAAVPTAGAAPALAVGATDASAPPPAFEGDPVPSADEGMPTIDVMVLYTTAARAAAGGTSAIEALIGLGVSEANTSYANSGIAQRIRLVRTEQVAYAEHNDLTTDLYNLTNNDGSVALSTEIGATAALLRNVHGADHVVLVTAAASPSYCGIGWLLTDAAAGDEPFAFTVVDEGCVSPQGSIAHELGHNMGARHDWYVDNQITPHTYAHGYVNITGRWRTMMAYSNLCSALGLTCTRILYWSNPAIAYGGVPMGIPAGTRSNCVTGNVSDVSCDADDHRTLNETAATVAAYRDGWRRAASDFTPDLRSDILWRHASAGDIWLWPMNGPLKLADTYVRTVPDPNWQIRGLGDLTGDGRADLLWRHAVSGDLYLWSMGALAPGSEAYVGTVSTAYDIAASGDFDGDGKSDVLWRNATTGELWVWIMNGAVPARELYVDTVDRAYGVAGVGDLDGDRKADIVWRNPSTGEVWAWLMDGAIRRAHGFVGSVADAGYGIVAVTDFTGDGKADLLWRHAAQGDVWLWPMSGTARTGESWVATVSDTAYGIAAAGDYDGDGKADILWHHAARGEVWAWLMDGAAKRSEALVGIVPDTGYRIVR